MHEGRGYRYTFQRACVASSPEVPKVTWWKIATFLGYHLHWLTSRHFRKIALRLGIFLAMFRECLCVVARQLAPKCHNFSNVAKLARQCKWPYLWLFPRILAMGLWEMCVITKSNSLQWIKNHSCTKKHQILFIYFPSYQQWMHSSISQPIFTQLTQMFMFFHKKLFPFGFKQFPPLKTPDMFSGHLSRQQSNWPYLIQLR